MTRRPWSKSSSGLRKCKTSGKIKRTSCGRACAMWGLQHKRLSARGVAAEAQAPIEKERVVSHIRTVHVRRWVIDAKQAELVAVWLQPNALKGSAEASKMSKCKYKTHKCDWCYQSCAGAQTLRGATPPLFLEHQTTLHRIGSWATQAQMPCRWNSCIPSVDSLLGVIAQFLSTACEAGPRSESCTAFSRRVWPEDEPHGTQATQSASAQSSICSL